jgi:hypothetical protein
MEYQVTEYMLGKLPTQRNFIFWITIVRLLHNTRGSCYI